MNTIITIIIPTYNRSGLIIKTLESIIGQSFVSWECIVVDDHSTDDTKAVVNEIMERDSRISYCINERKKGAQGARNTGLYKAKTDWVIFFDSDNIMHPDLLEELVAKISDGIDVVCCFSRIVDADKGFTGRFFDWINDGNIHDRLFMGPCYVDYNHAIIRKSQLFEIGGLDEDCPSMQEWDTHIRLSQKANYITVRKALVDYYVGGKDAISTDNKREIIGRFYILRKHHTEWKNHKDGYVRFVSFILQLIKSNPNISFRRSALTKLYIYAPDAFVLMLKARIMCRLRILFKRLCL